MELAKTLNLYDVYKAMEDKGLTDPLINLRNCVAKELKLVSNICRSKSTSSDIWIFTHLLLCMITLPVNEDILTEIHQEKASSRQLDKISKSMCQSMLTRIMDIRYIERA